MLIDFNKNYTEFRSNLTETNLIKYVYFFADAAKLLYNQADFTPERWAEMALAGTLLFKYINNNQKGKER